MTEQPVYFKVSRLDSGRWLCVAACDDPESEKTIVLTIGTGSTEPAAIADCKNGMLQLQAKGEVEVRVP